MGVMFTLLKQTFQYLEAHQVARQAANPLAPHRVPLVRHRARPDLGRLEGLLYLLSAGEEADVRADLVRRGPEAAQPRDNIRVNLPGVSLPRHDEAAGEARLGRDQAVEGLDLVVVSVKQLEEGGLGAGGALHAAEPEPLARRPQVVLVHQQLLQPQTRPLAHRGQLGGLQVGEAQRGQGGVAPREGGEARDDPRQFGQQQVEPVPDLDEVRVVPDVAGGGAQVDDGGGQGRSHPEGVDMRHHVVADLALLLRREGEVDVSEVVPHLPQLLLRDVEAQLLLRLGQPEPELAPGGELLLVGEVELHGEDLPPVLLLLPRGGLVVQYGLAGFWLSDALNANIHTFEVAPAFIAIEHSLLAYIRQLFGWAADQVDSSNKILLNNVVTITF